LEDNQLFFINPYNNSSFLTGKPKFPQILNEMENIEFALLLGSVNIKNVVNFG